VEGAGSLRKIVSGDDGGEATAYSRDGLISEGK